MMVGQDIEREFVERRKSLLKQIDEIKLERPEDWRKQVRKLATKISNLETELDLASSIRFTGSESAGRRNRNSTIVAPDFDSHSEDSNP